MEYAFPLITDLHNKEGNLESRRDYQKECDYVWDRVLDVILAHREKDRVVIPIFTGDIYHNSFDTVFQAVANKDTIVGIRKLVEDMFTALGNHETTYYNDNPFWTLFHTIESEKVRNILTKAWKPQGKIQTLRIVDHFKIGNVNFHFNHYGTPITKLKDSKVDGEVNIGIFHQDLYAKEIVEELESTKGLSIFEHDPVYFTDGPVLYGYDHAFFGHMHKLYGQWTYFCDRTYYTTELHYLGSLGRTNVTEVNDSFLERNIPSVIIKDGLFAGIEDFKFNLMNREQCVIEESVAINKIKYEKQKEVKRMTTLQQIADNPLDNVRANLAANPRVLTMFDDMLSKPKTQLEEEILNLIEKVKYL